MSILKSFLWISKLEINLKPILKILNGFEISIPRAGSESWFRHPSDVAVQDPPMVGGWRTPLPYHEGPGGHAASDQITETNPSNAVDERMTTSPLAVIVLDTITSENPASPLLNTCTIDGIGIL